MIAMATYNYNKIYGVKTWKNPLESKLDELEVVTKWLKWECSPARFPWSMVSGNEKAYFMKGKVKVYCRGYEGSLEIGAGNLVEFPRGQLLRA
ncbi:hypothetical protein Nepgr_004368 [Nepenthes gracilis]|uniref:(S)-ureidoglycine aminohydrolase cupin domain-containing protein n=1 Tax=Nepenthes gracilis TaxID=150966 RepID=A0AAD3S1H9_NEPGR|nr:hypothetical protein Nepgr_004368 [Nepenthes gracilis]